MKRVRVSTSPIARPVRKSDGPFALPVQVSDSPLAVPVRVSESPWALPVRGLAVDSGIYVPGDDPPNEPPSGFEPIEPEPGDEFVVEPQPSGQTRVKQSHNVTGHRFFEFTPAGQQEDVAVFTDVEANTNLGHQFGIYARFSGGKNTATTYLLRNNGTAAELCRINGGTVTVIASQEAAIQQNTRYRLRLEVEGDALRAWVWLATEERPSAPTFTETNDSITGAGALGMYAHNSTGTRYFYSFGWAALPDAVIIDPPPVPVITITSVDTAEPEADYELTGTVDSEATITRTWYTIDDGEEINL